MDISFCFVQGISPIDTPYFSSITAQEDYFDSKIVETITSTFYPPHYENVISVDSSDLDFNSQVNYLFFEFSGKRYYYFITSIEYQNENLVNISITMDTIQTFMFNIHVDNAMIERKHINKGTLSSPNKNFIRENVSSGDFVPLQKTILRDFSKPWAIVKHKKELKLNDNTTDIYRTVIKNSATGKDIELPYGIFIVPLFDCSMYGNEFSYKLDILTLLNTDPYVFDIIVVPFIPFDGIYYNSTTGVVSVNASYFKITSVTGQISGQDVTIAYPLIYPDYQDMLTLRPSILGPVGTFFYYYAEIYADIDYFPYSITSLLNIGSLEEFPALISSNYYRINYGSISQDTSLPIENIDSDLITCWTGINYNTGSLHYYIDKQGSYDNTYGTMVIDNNINFGDLFNDPYREYLARNRNEQVLAGMNAIVGMGQFVLTVASHGALAMVAKERVTSNPRSYTPRRGKLSAKAKRKLESIGDNFIEEMVDKHSGMIGNMMDLPRLAVTYSNYEHAPVTAKNTGAYQDNYTSLSNTIYLQVSRVRDINYVKEYYYRFGYLVHEPVSNITNIFTYAWQRANFNYLQLSICDIDLLNVINDEETIENIKSRFYDGIRLWKSSLPIGQFPGSNENNT